MNFMPHLQQLLCLADSAACCSSQAEETPTSRSISVDRALDVVQVAAAVKGEVQPWVWLLRTITNRFDIQSVHAGVYYLVSDASPSHHDVNPATNAYLYRR